MSKSKKIRQQSAEVAPIVGSTLPPLPSELPPVEEIGEEAMLAATTHTPEPAEPAEAPVPATMVGRRMTVATDQFIVVLRANPKKMGTAGYDRFAVYRTGMRVSEYLSHKAVGKYGRADLRWDLDRKFIEIVPTMESEAAPAEAEAEVDESSLVAAE